MLYRFRESMAHIDFIPVAFKGRKKRYKPYLFSCARLSLAVLLLCCLDKSSAQDFYSLQILTLDNDTAFLQKNTSYQTRFPDTTLLFDELENIIRQLQEQAYFEASFDSISIEPPTVKAFLHIGSTYEWTSLENGNIEDGFLDKSGFRKRFYQDKPVNTGQLQKLKERIVSEAENNGYPFASVRLDEIRFDGTDVTAKLFMDKGLLVFFDSLNVTGDVKISKNYLHQYLGIRSGEAYNRKKVLQIRGRLRELPFLQEKSNAVIRFTDNKASVNLSVAKKKASRFDFLLGVLPDNGRPETNLLITGTFNADMYNQFGLGERIFVSFERLRPQTQELELEFAYPYLLDLPFGVDLKFSQFKRDSTFTDVTGDFGVQYLFEGGNYLKAFWRTTASNLITVDTGAIRMGAFPDQLDIKNTDFGLEVNWQKLDYRFNPRKGWSAILRGSAGTRAIRRNQAILNVNESFYDTLPARTHRFVFETNAAWYFPVMQRSTIKAGLRAAAIVSGEAVYQNEQFRLGGNKLLRGFDEESIFATFFSVFTLEYRLLIGQNSYFYLFGDYGYLEDHRSGRPDRYDHPLGFGGGITFETSAGVFGISLAVGKTDSSPADLRNPKIHFGYVSIF